MNDCDAVPFKLKAHQVPEPPASHMWIDILRWLVVVMDGDDDYLSFVAGSFSYALKNNGVTAKQAKSLNIIYDRVLEEYSAEFLDCQNNGVIQSRS